MLLYEYMESTAPVGLFAPETVDGVPGQYSRYIAIRLPRRGFRDGGASSGCSAGHGTNVKSPLRLTAIFTLQVAVDIMTYFICADSNGTFSVKELNIFYGAQGEANGTKAQA